MTKGLRMRFALQGFEFLQREPVYRPDGRVELVAEVGKRHAMESVAVEGLAIGR